MSTSPEPINKFIDGLAERLAQTAADRDQWKAKAEAYEAEPLPMILFCPACYTQHIDKAGPDVCELCGGTELDHVILPPSDAVSAETTCSEFTAWLNPPHRKHRCHKCNHVWKPALVATTGVESLEAFAALNANNEQ